MSLRIAMVCTDPGIPFFGTKGASIHLQSVLKVLLDAGHQVHVLTPRPGPLSHPLASLVQLHPLPAVKGEDAAERERSIQRSDAAISAVLDRLLPDLVYERYSLWGRTCTQWAGERVPSILEVNAPLVQEQLRHRELVDVAGAESVAHDALLAARLVTCVSEPVAQWARSVAPGANIVVLPNGVDPERIAPAEGRHDGPFTVGFLGTLKPWHGVDTLLDAAALAAAAGNPWHVLMVGDGPLRADLEAAAARLGLDVEFTGALAASDVADQLNRMDVACAPYPVQEDDYFSPLKVYEYLAAGLPVVASAVGQIPEILGSDGDTNNAGEAELGVLVPPSDPAALAAAVTHLRNDPERRAALGRAARQRVLERHTWNAVVEQALEHVGLELEPA
ncbi:MAG: glycosyltransferase family 4 protein [Galactobacter sp.]